MVILMYFVLLIVVVAILCPIYMRLKNRDIEETERRMNLYSFMQIRKFSVSEYYDRIEKENDKILREKESQEKYTITLWFGNDGCRINDDGEVIWVKRNEPKKLESIPYNPYAMCNTINPLAYQMQGMAQSAQSQIDALQSQMCSLQAQASQQYQNTLLISQLNSIRYCPSYPTYSYYSYPYSFISPYFGCCNGDTKNN